MSCMWRQGVRETLWSTQLRRMPRVFQAKHSAELRLHLQGKWHMCRRCGQTKSMSSMSLSKVFTDENEQRRSITSRENLALFEVDLDGFLECFLTQTKCWFHCFEPETKRQPMQWKHTSSPAPRKVKVDSSAVKMITSVFRMQKALNLLTIFKKATSSMPTY